MSDNYKESSENQVVCSFELSKRLNEFGIEQESKFCWSDSPTTSKGPAYSAFTAGELMEMLPACINTGKNEPFNYFYLVLQKRTAPNIRYILNYNCDTHEGNEYFPRILIPHNIYDSNLANCLAKSLLWVKENGYLIT